MNPRPAGVAAVVRRRRMTRVFDGTPLPPGFVAGLCDTARHAPSAGFSQGIHFLVLEDEALARWWELTVDDQWRDEIAAGVGRAAAVVIPLADPLAYTARYSQPDKEASGLADEAAWPVPYWLTDTAMATQNLLLMVEDEGYGALFYGLFHTGPALGEFGVPAHVEALGAVAIGRRATGEAPSGSPRTVPRRATADVVHIARW